MWTAESGDAYKVNMEGEGGCSEGKRIVGLLKVSGRRARGQNRLIWEAQPVQSDGKERECAHGGRSTVTEEARWPERDEMHMCRDREHTSTDKL